MALSLKQSQAITKLSEALYPFLPGTPHPMASRNISFSGVADKIGLREYWIGGSKLPAIRTLLEGTLTYESAKFCDLILEIVRLGIQYRSQKNPPVTREELENLNEHIKAVGFKIPELHDLQFLAGFPSDRKPEASDLKKESQPNPEAIEALKKECLAISDIHGNEKGFVFEKFLNKLFAHFGLSPRSSFRITGEQIDGSLEFEHSTYLVEARWRNDQAAFADLVTFQAKVEGKAQWSRGIFISMAGFTPDGLAAFATGRRTSIIGLTIQDLYLVLDQKKDLKDLIRHRVRTAAETGEIVASVYEIK